MHFWQQPLSHSKPIAERLKRLSHYTTFGSPMPTRSWSAPSPFGGAGGGYKYGFNGKEKDNEVNVDGGDYDFGARIYDSRLSRWLSLDPIYSTGGSNYQAFKSSPLSIIDPTGETDFYSMAGDWIGTDGNSATNGVIRVITNYKISKAIEKISKKGREYTAELPNNSFYELPNQTVLNAIVETYDQSNENVYNEDGTIRTKGGEHEAGTAIDNDGIRTAIVHGPSYSPPALPSVILPIESGSVSIHTHPTIDIPNRLTGEKTFNVAKPSAADAVGFRNFGLNIIIGWDSKLTYSTSIDPVTQTIKSVENPRSLVVNFFNNSTSENGNPIFTISIEAIKKIQSGSGNNTATNKTKRKYEEKKAHSN